MTGETCFKLYIVLQSFITVLVWKASTVYKSKFYKKKLNRRLIDAVVVYSLYIQKESCNE